MEMETSSAQHHHQEMMGSQTLESILVSTKPQQEKKPRPADQEAIQCPRCDSPNTKFCYYNNYSLSQPRYFCKSCRRYWTKGGTLRNVPVGGGCRKNKRSSSSSTSTSPSSRRNQDHPMPSPIPCLTHLSYDHEHHSELSLAIARLQKQTNLQLGYDNLDFSILGDPNMAQSEGLGNSGVNTPTGYFEPPSGFHNMYYGMENGGMGINGISQEMGLGFEELGSTAVTNVKQEMCAGNGREDESGRVLWGFPWHGAGGDHGSHIGETDSNRLSWNGIGSANWHGLLNSPLM